MNQINNHLPKRTRRRQRGKMKSRLDAIAMKRICQNYLWSMETWGGTRCGGCGLKVPARFLTNLSGRIITSSGIGWITAFGYACHRVNNCPGEKLDWQLKVND